MTSAILALALEVGLKGVAEGVGRSAPAAFLSERCCDGLPGTLISTATTAAGCERSLDPVKLE